MDRGEHSIRQIARLFSVSLSFFVRLNQRRRATGSVEPKPHAGERLEAAAPGRRQNVTVIAGLRPTAVVAPLAFAGATDGAAFGAYVREVLAPELRPGDVVVWDNLQPHKNARAIKAVEAAG